MTCNLINGDCLEELKNIKDNSIDLIVTSPPYNLGHINRDCGGVLVKYNSYDDNLSPEDYETWILSVLNELYRVLSPKGLLYFNHKERHYKGRYFNPINLIEKSLFNPLQTIIWNRRGGATFNIGRFVNSYEVIIVAYKSEEYMRINKDYEKYFDVWTISPDHNPHMVASFPLELPLRIINAYDYKEHLVVLDPFMGSGTTGEACNMLNRDFLGIELDKQTYEFAVERCKEYQSRLI